MTIPAQTGISAKTVFLKSVTVTLICRQKIPFLKKYGMAVIDFCKSRVCQENGMSILFR